MGGDRPADVRIRGASSQARKRLHETAADLLERVHLWNTALVSETVYWVLVTGSVLVLRTPEAGEDQDFFKKALLSAASTTVVVEFLANLRPMPLIPELLLMPVLVVLGGSMTLANTRDEYREFVGVCKSQVRFSSWGRHIHHHRLLYCRRRDTDI